MSNKFEQLLELLLNEETEKAAELLPKKVHLIKSYYQKDTPLINVESLIQSYAI